MMDLGTLFVTATSVLYLAIAYYLACCGFKEYVWATENRHRRQVELMDKMIELERLKMPVRGACDEQGGASNEPETHQRNGVPDGEATARDCPELPAA